MSVIKGQNLRILVSGSAVACATSCTINMSANVEDSTATTKDTTSADWATQEVTGLTWDGSADGLVSVDTDSDGKNFFDFVSLLGTEVTIDFSQTSGTMNRKETGKKLTGTAILTQISATAPDRQNSTYSISFTGTGALTVKASS